MGIEFFHIHWELKEKPRAGLERIKKEEFDYGLCSVEGDDWDTNGKGYCVLDEYFTVSSHQIIGSFVYIFRVPIFC